MVSIRMIDVGKSSVIPIEFNGKYSPYRHEISLTFVWIVIAIVIVTGSQRTKQTITKNFNLVHRICRGRREWVWIIVGQGTALHFKDCVTLVNVIQLFVCLENKQKHNVKKETGKRCEVTTKFSFKIGKISNIKNNNNKKKQEKIGKPHL